MENASQFAARPIGSFPTCIDLGKRVGIESISQWQWTLCARKSGVLALKFEVPGYLLPPMVELGSS